MGSREEELAARLARHLTGMRSTSMFALETFLDAVENDDVVGAQLSLAHTKGSRLEAELRIGAGDR